MFSPGSHQGVHFRPIKHSNVGATQHYEVVFNTLESASVYSIVKLQGGTWRSVLLNNIDNCAPLLHTGCTFNADGTFLLVRGSDKRSVRVIPMSFTFIPLALPGYVASHMVPESAALDVKFSHVLMFPFPVLWKLSLQAMVFDTGAKGGHLDVVNPRCTFKCGKKVFRPSRLSPVHQT